MVLLLPSIVPPVNGYWLVVLKLGLKAQFLTSRTDCTKRHGLQWCLQILTCMWGDYSPSSLGGMDRRYVQRRHIHLKFRGHGPAVSPASSSSSYPPSLASLVFLCSPCPPHPSPGNFLSKDPSFLGLQDYFFVVEERNRKCRTKRIRLSRCLLSILLLLSFGSLLLCCASFCSVSMHEHGRSSVQRPWMSAQRRAALFVCVTLLTRTFPRRKEVYTTVARRGKSLAASKLSAPLCQRWR